MSWLGEFVFFCLLSPLVWCLAPGLWWRRGAGLAPAAADLPRRRRAWSVLSDLYLDTEFDDWQYDRMARELDETRYTINQLEAILYVELHPILIGNLFSMAGEWAGFDQASLEQRLLARPRHDRRLSVLPGKWMVSGGWKRLRRRLRALRAGPRTAAL